MANNNQIQGSIKDLTLEDVKKFISSVQQTQQPDTFKPERLKNMREATQPRSYNSGMSS